MGAELFYLIIQDNDYDSLKKDLGFSVVLKMFFNFRLSEVLLCRRALQQQQVVKHSCISLLEEGIKFKKTFESC